MQILLRQMSSRPTRRRLRKLTRYIARDAGGIAAAATSSASASAGSSPMTRRRIRAGEPTRCSREIDTYILDYAAALASRRPHVQQSVPVDFFFFFFA